MSCCAASILAAAQLRQYPSAEEIRVASHALNEREFQTDFSVPGIHCHLCISSIEMELGKLPGVTNVRVNLSARRVSVQWHGVMPPPLAKALNELGYEAHIFEADNAGTDPELPRLIRALAVAGFCAMNIMLLSVSIWSGADADTRQAFHTLSAVLALPALLYSGRIFFLSAWQALRHGRTNMDVPISIGIALACALSLYDTIHNGPHAYFDAATSLLFFLLIGRTLDHVMREKARNAVRGLARLAPRGATIVDVDGTRRYLPLVEIQKGMSLFLTPGERVPVDGRVIEGASEIDYSIVTGENTPVQVVKGFELRAGAMNLTGSLTLEVTATPETSFLAEMIRLMQAAEDGKARYRRVADRAARLYSPVVHAAALVTFIVWMIMVGDGHFALSTAIAVLIITCPCALGLAVPIVQVVAARRLFEAGIMVKDGSAMERLAEIDTAVFDKTGTLTLGRPVLTGSTLDSKGGVIAAAMAAHSHHPVARAIAEGSGSVRLKFSSVTEHPGLGLEAMLNGVTYRLGRSSWALATGIMQTGNETTVLSRNGEPVEAFYVSDRMRSGAKEAIATLKAHNLEVEIVSGDSKKAVGETARNLGIAKYAASMLPEDKIARLSALAAAGHKTLMIGDGLNDAPALAGAYVSMAPATAADIGRNAADFVFLRESLIAVPFAHSVSKSTQQLIHQNFALAIGYNALALPLAALGYLTPLIAALAMSLSSVIVVANSLRLERLGLKREDSNETSVQNLKQTLKFAERS